MARPRAVSKGKGVARSPRRRRESPEKAGQLKPADPFDLIRLLARSQHDPRKAVAELVQNSLDAGARVVQITRLRQRGVKLLCIRDDGQGVIPELGRKEALSYIATHIGRSRKRDLSVQDRYELFLQGKYGIGLLGFWCVGRQLEMRTKVGPEPALVLRLAEDSPRYEIHKDRRELEFDGVWTEVRVLDLHDGALRQLAGRRLSDFLAEELRGQLLEREVEVLVEDRLARGRAQRSYRVVPQRFRGVPLAELQKLPVPGHHAARLHLHYVADEGGERGRVALAANGTLVVEDLAAVPGCDHPPWTDGRIVGVVDFPDLQVAPAARRGFVPDAAATALLRALPELEARLEEILGRFEAERERERDAALVKQLQRIFRDFGRRLPHYDLFEVQRSAAQQAAAEGRAEKGAPVGEPLPAAEDALPPLGGAVAQPQLFPPGPLASVAIEPAEPLVAVGQRRTLRAVPRDGEGRRIARELQLDWRIASGAALARLVRDEQRDLRALLQAGELPGTLEVVVEARDGEQRAEARVAVQIVEAVRPSGDADLGIPEPQPVYAPAEPWRSRVVEGRWEYNAGHPDYLDAAEDPRRKLRYVATLLGKEIVLRRHRSDFAAAVLEQLVEVLAWIDRRLR